jgi:hypothetical protein
VDDYNRFVKSPEAIPESRDKRPSPGAVQQVNWTA